MSPSPVDVRFPLRAAAIDVGSNAIRILIAEFTAADRYTALETERAPVRLGHDAFLTGRLPPEAMDAAVAALARFRERMDTLGVEHHRAVATSAVRESRNGGELVERIQRETGIHLETITGHEEARLVWMSVRHRVPLGDRKWILVDLGGGSVEVSLVDRDGLFWSESHTMGSVRLLEELSGSGEEPGRFRRLLAEYAGTLKIPAASKHWNPAGMIATGGNIETLAKLASAPADENGVSILPLRELDETIETLARLSYRQRVDQLGLREDRADVILPAAVVYQRLAVLAGADRIRVPQVGVREGVVLDLVESLATHQAYEHRHERELAAGALALGRRYLFDEAHARHVAELSLALFDQLAAVHGLGAAGRRLLLAAALLHDIGQFVAYRRHHRHSYYLLSHSEVPGLDPHETALVALIARYHRRAEPHPQHEGFATLAAEEREVVEALAGLLRLADALDREHLQRVTGVEARVAGRELRLELAGSGDLLLEQWAVRNKAVLFERVFRLRVRLHVAGSVTP